MKTVFLSRKENKMEPSLYPYLPIMLEALTPKYDSRDFYQGEPIGRSHKLKKKAKMQKASRKKNRINK